MIAIFFFKEVDQVLENASFPEKKPHIFMQLCYSHTNNATDFISDRLAFTETGATNLCPYLDNKGMIADQ